jgi:hypothetical protein
LLHNELYGDSLEQALAHIVADSNQFLERISKLHPERFSEASQRPPGGDNSSSSHVQNPVIPKDELASEDEVFARYMHVDEVFSTKIEDMVDPRFLFKDSPNNSSLSITDKLRIPADEQPLISSTLNPLSQSDAPMPLASSQPPRLIDPTRLPSILPPRRLRTFRDKHVQIGDVPMIGLPKPMAPHSIPMANRPYRAGHNYHTGAARPRIGRVIAIDIRTCHPVSGYENPPVAEAYIRYVTILTGEFEPYIFPDIIHNTPLGPYDLPQLRWDTWGDRVDAMFLSRTTVLGIIQKVHDALSPYQIVELHRPLITMFITEESGVLSEATIDRRAFYQSLHPNHNPFLNEAQATFLRGACYYFRRIQHHVLAEAIDVLLRSPQYNDFYCRLLVETGCFDKPTPFNRLRALDHIKIYEDEMLEEDNLDEEIDSSDEEKVEDMDTENPPFPSPVQVD